MGYRRAVSSGGTLQVDKGACLDEARPLLFGRVCWILSENADDSSQAPRFRE